MDDSYTLDLKAGDLAMIEDALQTQHKILSVQAQAGGARAKARLENVKQLLKRLNKQTQTEKRIAAGGWSRRAWSLLC